MWCESLSWVATGRWPVKSQGEQWHLRRVACILEDTICQALLVCQMQGNNAKTGIVPRWWLLVHDELPCSIFLNNSTQCEKPVCKPKDPEPYSHHLWYKEHWLVWIYYLQFEGVKEKVVREEQGDIIRGRYCFWS